MTIHSNRTAMATMLHSHRGDNFTTWLECLTVLRTSDTNQFSTMAMSILVYRPFFSCGSCCKRQSKLWFSFTRQNQNQS
uniref:Uncharacterized protein n=1 Tax=Arundo donax TaxID=35708 RepID=A0A0A9HP19_ARUDO